MTFKELETMVYDIDAKVRAIQTFAVLLNESVISIGNIKRAHEVLPPIDDITALTLNLANCAEAASNKLLNSLPSGLGGISP